MAFTGIPFAALDFYDDLEADNSKAFWTAHKPVYLECVRAPLEALAAELEAEFGPAKLFRPYRDVRFAKDKTPYKTHQGMWLGETSRYLQIGPAGLFVAAGYWSTGPAQVDRLRRAVADDVAGPALERAVAAVRAEKMTVGGHQLSRVPAGYDKQHPREQWLRYKTLVGSRELGFPGWLATRRAKAEVVRAWRALDPLVAWLDTHVGRD
jgi:uncharacterized protein (TIGR02453 family)